MNKPILVTGPAGSGKSFLNEYLKSIDVRSVDMDRIRDLSKWVDNNGIESQYPENASAEWLANHKYVWDRKVLEEHINQGLAEVYLGLSADDASDFKDLFSDIFYLKVPADTLAERLMNRDNIHGKTEDQRQLITRDIKSFDNKAERNGYIIIDASKSPEEIWAAIKSHFTETH